MIVFDEYGYCNFLLNNKIDRIYQRDLNYLSSYWFESFGQKGVTDKLKEWCLKQDPEYNLIINRHKIKNAISHGKKYALRKLVTIAVSEGELKSIQKIEDYKIQKIIFCMLITAKFFKYNNSRKIPRTKPENIGVYYNKAIRDIWKLAGVQVSRKEWKEARRRLYDLGLVSPTLTGKYKLIFVDDASKPVLAVEDYRNVVGYYQEFVGENVIRCDKCGKMFLKKSNRHKMCKRCYMDKENERVKNYNITH